VLDLDKISNIDAHGEEWKKLRRGRFTASLIGKLISEKSHEGRFTLQAMTYIESIAGEHITGTPAKADFRTDYTDWGEATEAEAIACFQQMTGKQVLRNTDRMDTHRLIIEDEFSACTPDALVCMAKEQHIFDETGTKLKVAPLETKCPAVLSRFIKLYRCLTPSDLKKVEPLYYWQVLTQMLFCGSLIGYFGAYNPHFPVKMRIIEFKQMDLTDDIKKLKATLQHAKKEVENIASLFTLEKQ
jgi:hypothetical protein